MLQKWQVELNIMFITEGNMLTEIVDVTANTLKAALVAAERSVEWKHRNFYPSASGPLIAVLPTCEIELIEIKAILN